MANIKKMTKKDYFEQIKRNYALTEDEVKFIDHEIELLEKKNAADKKPTAQQVANKSTQDAIYEGMTPNRLYSVTEIIKEVPACAELTNQRVSALLRQMMPERIERVEEKRKAYFRVVVAE